MAWQDGDIDIDGARIHYYRRGHGRPLLLAHGASDNGKCWARVAAALEGSFDIVAYDARNHGFSDAFERGLSGGGRDLIAVFEALELEKPAIMGHSMGAGAVAQAVLMRPELFQCAVLEDPAWREAGTAPVRRTGPDLSTMTVEQIAEHGAKVSLSWHADEFPAWAESKKQFRPQDPSVFGPRGEWRDAAKGMTIPTLLVTGGSFERGAIVTKAVAAEASSLNPMVETVCFEEAGHNVRREAFEGFVAAVSAFLDAHAAGQ